MSERRKRSRRRPELSQHFLRSPALAANLAQQAPISPTDLVVEIGPGDGILTAALADRVGELRAVEIDPELCHCLRQRFHAHPGVSVAHADFLTYSLPKDRAFKVIGNIPYSRTSAIVGRIAEATPPPQDALLILQKEAAERFAGRPFAPETQASLTLKPWWHLEIVRRLRRTDFQPPPRVDSVVLHMARRTRPLLEADRAQRYREFIATTFGRRGNTVGQCLRGTFTRKQVQRLSRDLNFDPSVPPGWLWFEQWLGLYRFLTLP